MGDTGLAPTAEEWTVARSLGKPIVVFKQAGMEPVPDQQTFIAEVESYATGVFRDTFSSTAELLEKLPAALEAAARALQPLTPRQLDQPITIVWRQDGSPSIGSGVVLESHVLPVGPTARIRVSDLPDLARRLARTARDAGFFQESDALDMRVIEQRYGCRFAAPGQTRGSILFSGAALGPRGWSRSNPSPSVAWPALLPRSPESWSLA